jgi:bacterioferritin-associated ferredoxin
MITETLEVKTPTKKEYIEVVQCMLDNGNAWANGEQKVLEDNWERYKNETIVLLGFFLNSITCSCYSSFYTKTYTSEEFLDKYNTILNGGSTWKKHEEDNLVKDKNMNIKKFVKTLTLSKEDKLLREYGLQNDCGDFTEEARELVINKLVEDNKAYLVEITTKIKEEDKK